VTATRLLRETSRASGSRCAATALNSGSSTSTLLNDSHLNGRLRSLREVATELEAKGHCYERRNEICRHGGQTNDSEGVANAEALENVPVWERFPSRQRSRFAGFYG
jgi:hypothetical protein